MSSKNLTEVQIERQVSKERLDKMGVFSWPIWTKSASEFPWTYDESETCYLLEGDVIVTPDGGESVRFGKGDLAVFSRSPTLKRRFVSVG